MAFHTEEDVVLKANTIAKHVVMNEKHMNIEVGQAVHRVRLLDHWQIPQGSTVLEIGCGQGTTTAALAVQTGPDGHVDAVDPASPDYGSPFTLGQAQAHISKGEMGGRITWHCEDPVEFLEKREGKTWDFVVFAHSIWYFDGPHVLARMLKALRGRAKTLLVAEYALKATEKTALPHVMSAVARATLEAHNPDSAANIRCLLSPSAIKAAAAEQGWTLSDENNVVPEAMVPDGGWESSTVKSEAFLKEIDKHVADAKVASVLRSTRDGVCAAMEALGGEKVKTMDVWVAKLT